MSISFLIKLMTPPKLSKNVELGPEDQISVEFANRLRAWTLEGSLKAVWSHVPNEVAGSSNPKLMRRAQLRYAIAKALGLIPGTPDYIFLSSGGAACIEMKSKSGGLQDNQKDFREWCALAGVPYAVCRSADQAEAQLREWGLLV